MLFLECFRTWKVPSDGEEGKVEAKKRKKKIRRRKKR